MLILCLADKIPFLSSGSCVQPFHKNGPWSVPGFCILLFIFLEKVSGTFFLRHGIRPSGSTSSPALSFSDRKHSFPAALPLNL